MRVLDLFSGIGGFSLGLEAAGLSTVAFCESDKHCIKVLKKHWPRVPVFDDICGLKASVLKERVDMVCGGFPCQDLSVAGAQKGFLGERSILYRQMLRIISECQPRVALFENVPGLLAGDGGRWFAQFLYDLAAIGFDAQWDCIPASHIGAPHRRDRVWILAYPLSAIANRVGCERFTQIAHHIQQQVELVRGLARENNRFDLSEPALCGADDGVSGRTHRLRQLGNAVVPMLPEIYGRAILCCADEGWL